MACAWLRDHKQVNGDDADLSRSHMLKIVCVALLVCLFAVLEAVSGVHCNGLSGCCMLYV